MTENTEQITFIATGGTIDKKYNRSTQQNELKEISDIPSYLNDALNIDVKNNFHSFMRIDSRDMDDTHRQKIGDYIKTLASSKIILLHGTDTMVTTAKFLEEYLTPLDKTIILTGAMVPLDGFYQSDAPFNLGYAMAQAENKQHGVYICMNAHTFLPSETEKNIADSRFELKSVS